MDYEIYTSEDPDDPVIDEISEGLINYNLQFVKKSKRCFNAALKSQNDGSLIGGAECISVWGWMHVKNIWVNSNFRKHGHGSKLIAIIEQEARARQCVGVHLDTFSFQARGFYEKLGYTPFGHLDDFPQGHAQTYLSKRFD